MRVLIGEVPASFLIELVIRAIFIYIILMVSMRLMGKRMSSELSRVEMAALVSLAAAIGVPLMAPDRGLLPAVVIAAVLVFIERLIAARAAHSERFESLTQGQINALITDGVISMKALKSVGLSRERLFAQLRSMGVSHTGLIRRLYMEANGAFTLVKAAQPVAGLPTFPGWDDRLTRNFIYADDLIVCDNCAFTAAASAAHADCLNCSKRTWARAVKDIKL